MNGCGGVELSASLQDRHSVFLRQELTGGELVSLIPPFSFFLLSLEGLHLVQEEEEGSAGRQAIIQTDLLDADTG